MSEENQEQQKIEEPKIEQVPEQPEVKIRKTKVYQKKGLDERGRKVTEGKTTAYGLPVDVDYFKKYYHEKLAVKIQCDQCLMFVCKVNLKKHTQRVSIS